jgi:hypothetical protein
MKALSCRCPAGDGGGEAAAVRTLVAVQPHRTKQHRRLPFWVETLLAFSENALSGPFMLERGEGDRSACSGLRHRRAPPTSVSTICPTAAAVGACRPVLHLASVAVPVTWAQVEAWHQADAFTPKGEDRLAARYPRSGPSLPRNCRSAKRPHNGP